MAPNGNVGIGTFSANRNLTIANSTGANYMNINDGTHELLMGVDGTGGIISVMTNHDLVFRTGGNVDKMRITAAGNVGIGMVPTYDLDVNAHGVRFSLAKNGGGDTGFGV